MSGDWSPDIPGRFALPRGRTRAAARSRCRGSAIVLVVSVEKTLLKVEADPAEGDTAKARQRLTSLVSAFPERLDVREHLARVCRLQEDGGRQADGATSARNPLNRRSPASRRPREARSTGCGRCSGHPIPTRRQRQSRVCVWRHFWSRPAHRPTTVDSAKRTCRARTGGPRRPCVTVRRRQQPLPFSWPSYSCS